MSDHPWISKSGRLWSPRVRSDLCAKCGRTPDAHPFPVPRWLSEAIALANRVLDRPHEDPDSDMAILARGVVRLREAHEPCACGREAALAQPSEPGLDVERLANVLRDLGFVRGVAQRYGNFNDAYWVQSAEAIAREYARAVSKEVKG